MSSFGQNLVCTNLTCTTINGNSPSADSSKWTELPVTKDIERNEGDVIVKNELKAETATINDSLTVEDGTTLLNGKTQLIAKLGSQDILQMQGDRSNGSTYIDVNTAGVDLAYPESIYLLQMEKKPDRSENGLFRINIKGDIIGARNVDLEKLTLPAQLSYKGCQVITALTGGTADARTVAIPAGGYICFFDLTLSANDVSASSTNLTITFETTALPLSDDEINQRKYTIHVSHAVSASPTLEVDIVYIHIANNKFNMEMASNQVLLGERISFTVQFIEIQN